MRRSSWDSDGAREEVLTKRFAQNCLTQDELEEFLFARLAGVTSEMIEEHLLVCEPCLDRVNEEESYVQAFRTAARQAEAEDSRPAMAGARSPQPGWREKLFAGWALLGGRSALAMACVALAVIGVFSSPLLRGPAAETPVILSLARGAEDLAVSAPAGASLRLSANVAELPSLDLWQVEVVDGRGKLEHRSEVVATGGSLNWKIEDGLASGRHWVRLRDPRDGSLVREYGLGVR